MNNFEFKLNVRRSKGYVYVDAEIFSARFSARFTPVRAMKLAKAIEREAVAAAEEVLDLK